MTFRLVIKEGAKKQLANLPRQTRERIDERILTLAETPRPHGVEKLSGADDLYRVRVGDYRIIYEIADELLIVLVVRIGHRRDVYR